VRGDSLRDFYAKTFVVLGLGVIAGAGALVDYWPTGSDVPAVASVRLPQPAIRTIAPDFRIVIPAPIVRAAVPRPLPVSPAADVMVATLSIASPEPVELPAAPPPQPPRDFIVALAVPALATADVWLEAPPMPEPIIAAPSPLQERVAGAIKWTRESIREARATVRGALTGMFGTLRRMSPFFSTAAAFQQ
jgi:hypothetical protein